jgi:hypothetical protein
MKSYFFLTLRYTFLWRHKVCGSVFFDTTETFLQYPLDDSLSNTTCCSSWIVNFWKRYICICGPFFPAFLLKYAWILCINSWASLCKFTFFFSIWKQGYNIRQGTDANLQHRSSAADAHITQLLNRPEISLISRPSLRWSITHIEQNSTNLPLHSTEKHYGSAETDLRAPTYVPFYWHPWHFSCLLFSTCVGGVVFQVLKLHVDTILFTLGTRTADPYLKFTHIEVHRTSVL